MKAKELIEFLQQYPEADVVFNFGDGESYAAIGDLQYLKPEDMLPESAEQSPKGIVYMSENKHF